MKFLFVVVGRDCETQAPRALASIAAQKGDHDFRVVVIDDASTDRTAQVVKTACDTFGDDWVYMLNDSPVGAMANQWTAWHLLDLEPDDVVIWCDLDDRLAHDEVLNVLSAVYADGATMTYGSYRADPQSDTCPVVAPYPAAVIEDRSFRRFILAHGGILHNHLRTVSWRLLCQITEADCKDSEGRWWMAAPDFAVMLPCMELAGETCRFIPDELYVYTSDLASAEWRLRPRTVNQVHQEILRRRPKFQQTDRATRRSVIAAKNERIARRR